MRLVGVVSAGLVAVVAVSVSVDNSARIRALEQQLAETDTLAEQLDDLRADVARVSARADERTRSQDHRAQPTDSSGPGSTRQRDGALVETSKTERPSYTSLEKRIDSYKDGALSLSEYRQLVDVILDDQDKKMQVYRRPSLDAIIVRFSKEDLTDPQTRSIRRQIGLKLIELMKKPGDKLGRLLVEELVYTFWRAKSVEIKFRAADHHRERSLAYAKMQSYLKNLER